jgi:carboxymethylenebutenolidase
MDDEIRQRSTDHPAAGQRADPAGTFVLDSPVTTAQAEVVERDVSIPMVEGVCDSVLFYPQGDGAWPAVLVWPDIQGLRPVFRQMGRRLAAEGYVVLVPNPFYRHAKAPVVDGPFDFSKPETRAKMTPLMAALTAEANISDAISYATFLDQQPQTDKSKKMGVEGYCMGGPLTFRTAAAMASRIAAVATFHSGNLITDKAESPHLAIPSMKAEVLCCIADNDDQRDPTVKDRLKDAFTHAHLQATVEVFEGNNHGWTVPGSHAYNQAGAERAWGERMALYRRNLS